MLHTALTSSVWKSELLKLDAAIIVFLRERERERKCLHLNEFISRKRLYMFVCSELTDG